MVRKSLAQQIPVVQFNELYAWGKTLEPDTIVGQSAETTHCPLWTYIMSHWQPLTAEVQRVLVTDDTLIVVPEDDPVLGTCERQLSAIEHSFVSAMDECVGDITAGQMLRALDAIGHFTG